MFKRAARRLYCEPTSVVSRKEPGRNARSHHRDPNILDDHFPVWGYKEASPTTVTVSDLIIRRFNVTPQIDESINVTDWASYTKDDKAKLRLPTHIEEWLDRSTEVQLSILKKFRLVYKKDWASLTDAAKVELTKAGLTATNMNYFNDCVSKRNGFVPPPFQYYEAAQFLKGPDHTAYPEETNIILKSAFFIDDIGNVDKTGCEDLRENYLTLVEWSQKYYLRRWTSYNKKGLLYPKTRDLSRLLHACAQCDAVDQRLTQCGLPPLEYVNEDSTGRVPRAEFVENAMALIDPFLMSLWRVMERTPEARNTV